MSILGNMGKIFRDNTLTHSAFTIVAAKQEASKDLPFIRFIKDKGQQFIALQTKTGANFLVVNENQIRAFDTLFSGELFDSVSSYREIKNKAWWRSMYEVQPQPWFYCDPKTGTRLMPMVDVLYCRHCGMQIPLRIASIDHQAPQTGGEIQAIARLFRAVGCTKASGIGKKSSSIMARHAAAIGAPAVPPGGSKTDRYTLNEIGTLYYSALLATNHADELKKAAMNSGINLRPICPPCNSKLNNQNLM